jgi:hypothetical protein
MAMRTSEIVATGLGREPRATCIAIRPLGSKKPRRAKKETECMASFREALRRESTPRTRMGTPAKAGIKAVKLGAPSSRSERMK